MGDECEICGNPVADCTCGEAVRMQRDNDGLRREVAMLREDRSQWIQATGLATTAVPDMEIDCEHPIEMMHRVVAEIERLRAECDRLAAEVARLTGLEEART